MQQQITKDTTLTQACEFIREWNRINPNAQAHFKGVGNGKVVIEWKS